MDSYHKNLKAKCYRCGKCCTFIVTLKRKEIDRIAQRGFSPKEFVARDLDKDYIKLINGKCFFLRVDDKGNNYCEIYEERPNPCIMFPGSDKSITKCEHFEEDYLKKNRLF